MRRLTAVGLILAAVAFLAGSSAAQRASFWPALTGEPLVQEWYADIPWHQKLGTYAGNEINVPIVLPYDALEQNEKDYCRTHNLGEPACMLEVGIVNILGAHRTDTLYDPDWQNSEGKKIKDIPECNKGQPCVEVRLDLSSFWTRTEQGVLKTRPRPFGTKNGSGDGEWGGYAINDGSTYASQFPWYMSHYCDAFYPGGDTQDPVCYGDYFSPMNNAFNVLPGTRLDQWPRSAPLSVYQPQANGQCAGGAETTVCTLAMAGFDLLPLPQDQANWQYKKHSEFLLEWFNSALENFPKDRDNTRHFPWSGARIDWAFLYPRAVHNPFLGTFDSKLAPNVPTCENTLHSNNDCPNTGNTFATHFVYPRQCSLGDLTQAAAGSESAANALRNCGINYELHHNGQLEGMWPQEYWGRVRSASITDNEYGRTSFLFAGVPGLQQAVSFYKEPDADLSIYERVYNATIFSLDLPVTNVADSSRSMPGRRYKDTEFYHTLLMSNHMESDPPQFAEGISGKVLWHNEYRTLAMYKSRGSIPAPDYVFAAAFKPQDARLPFHNYTCDGCHVRNGSGVPINTDKKLDEKLREFMSGAEYKPEGFEGGKDYTFTGEIRPMKLVFFDLRRDTSLVDSSRYSEPLTAAPKLFEAVAGVVNRIGEQVVEGVHHLVYYKNKIMNFYGDSFHVGTPEYSYRWNYEAVDPRRLVVDTRRHNSELGKTYELLQAKLREFSTPAANCAFTDPPTQTAPWPTSCADIGDAAIHAAIDGGEVGFMHLNGKRLGNLSAIEAIPNAAIIGFQESQKSALGEKIAGEIIWNVGSRDGVDGVHSQVHTACKNKSLADCYIGRFGWIGDRVSLEDQVANAAFVEMNITTTAGYKKLYGNKDVQFPIRYAYPNCGPANKACVDLPGNSDLSEQDVQRMADYARWVGNPNRSEFQVSLPEVIQGEKIFRQLKCDTCHVIGKIEIPDAGDTILSKFFRDRLAARTKQGHRPFLSYIGTDLLMHDMGYLSQVGNASQSLRDGEGVVKPEFINHVQKIRTPALKGLRFNRFVTDAHRNTQNCEPVGTPDRKTSGCEKNADAACDFLLHDGRACDAIEAAFLHDGPAIKKLGIIDELNRLSGDMIKALRAFLYSL
jgi:CxxC motif-containing protein (DUF1111 family)